MRILFASKHNYGGKQPVGGVQSWSKTLGQEFVKLGYEVVFWEPRKPAPDGAFDAGIFANVAFTGKLMALCRKTLVVSHGIIEDEMPVGGDVVAYTSEGVKRHWGGAGPIIRQPIDLGFWWQAEAPRKGVVRYSYRDGLEFLGPLCDKMGLPYRHVRGVTHEQAREAMHGASCVLATGRAAILDKYLERRAKPLSGKAYSALSTQAVDNYVGDLCRWPPKARIQAGQPRRSKSRQTAKSRMIKDLQTPSACQGLDVKKVPVRQKCA